MSGIIGGAGSKSGVIGTTELDYEEGTWTAAIAVDSGSITINDETGSYVKIGKSVHLNGRFTMSSISSPVGDVSITGLPFTADSVGGYIYASAVTLALDRFTGTANQIVGIIPDGGSVILVREMLTTGAGADVGVHMQATTTIHINAVYKTA